MATLAMQNQFATLTSNPFQYEIDYERESIQVPQRNRTVNNSDRIYVKAQTQSETKIDSVCEERRCFEETVSTKVENTDDGCFVPQQSQPPRENSPAVFVPESCVDDNLGAIDDDVEREYFMRCVVLGAKNTGKHTLINSNFSEDSRKSENAGVDLMMKTSIRNRTTKKYHFWVNTLGDNSATKEAIWKTYYKSANAFVFVYDITDKKSFEALEQAVRSVLQVVPQDKFFGVLVGTKNDRYAEREVDYEEAANFKLRYNFSHFIETCSSIETETPQMLPRISAKLKLTFESL